MIPKLIYYGAGTVIAVAIAASLIKKKPSGKFVMTGKVLSAPKTYVVAPGDKSDTIAARFGVTYADIQKANGKAFVPVKPGNIWKLPAGVADMGPRPGANGMVP